MTKEQAINYLYSSGMSEEQVKTVVEALSQEPTNVIATGDGAYYKIKALQADGEKTCGTCRNEDTYHCADCENKSDYEQAQADGEYILKSEAIRVASGYCHPSNIAKELEKLPSVAIPSAEPKTGHWILKIEDWNKWICSECGYTERTDIHVSLGYDFCPKCGAKMVEPQAESEVKERMTQIDLEIPKCCDECKFVYDSCKCIMTGSRLDRDKSDSERLLDCPLNKIAEPYKGMTNGEVIKAMFGDDKVSEFMGYARIMARVGNWFNDGVVAEFDKDWWNSPFEPQESEG